MNYPPLYIFIARSAVPLDMEKRAMNRCALFCVAFAIVSLLVPFQGVLYGGEHLPRTAQSGAGSYWHTVHYANWEHGDLPPSKIPWQSITNLIHFAGNTLGAQTNGTYPYWQAPSNWEIDNSYPAYAHIGDTLRAYGAQYGVIIEIDAGFNSSNQYYNVCVKGDTAIATWASQVGHYMVNWNYGGVDFDLEGGSYPPNYGFQKMVQFLHDTLAALNPGKKYYFTASVMPNSGDQTGWGILGGPNPAINLMDQINPMFYDVSGTFGSPLYKDPNCSTWGSDSGVTVSLLGVGIPANKLGLGYNIQVYHTASTTACPPGGFGYISKLMNEIQYFPPATGATIYWDDAAKESYMINTTAGVKVAYEDTLSTYYKADFIKRKGLGGAMGFCLGRGYLPKPPAGWLPHMAVQGMGRILLNGGTVTPPVDTTRPIVSLLSPANGDTVTGTVTLSAQATDNVGVAKVEFLLNGAVLGTVYSAPYSFAWNTQNLTGSQILAARATDAAGNSATSASAAVVVVAPPPVPPGAPLLTSPANGATGQPTTLTLTWAASSTATRYHLQLSTVSDFSLMTLEDTAVAGTSRQVGPLAYAATYFWRVSAANAYGEGSFSGTWSFTTGAAPPPDTIANPAVLRDDFNAPNGPVAGRSNWTTITNSFADGALVISDSAVQAISDSGLYNFGGNIWDTLMSAGSEISVTVTSKSGNTSYSSCFLYAKLNSTDYNTATGYRLRYLQQSGTDAIEIQRVGPGMANGTTIVHTNYEVNPGDQLKFRVLADNKTLAGLVNNTIVITLTDSVYMPQQWYFAVRTCVFPTPFRLDNFKASSEPSSITLAAPVPQSPANGALLAGTSVTMSWGSAVSASSYHVQLAGDSLFAALVLDDSAVTSLSRSISGLAAGARYFWRVCAVSGAVTGPWSSTMAFATQASTSILKTSRSQIDFGNVAIGKTKNDSVVVMNAGTKSLNIVSVNSTTTQFAANPSTMQLAPGNSQNLYIAFTPSQKTNYAGLVITLTDSSGLTDTVAVTGKGVNPPRGQRNRTAIVFGTVSTSTPSVDSFTVTNTGDLSLTLTRVQSTSAAFSVQPSAATIPPADSQTFYVTTTSSATGLDTGYVVLSGNGVPTTDSLLVAISSASGVSEKAEPREYALMQNYPNPFNPTTRIVYTIPVRSHVLLRVYNALGMEIATPVDEIQESGVKTATWGATNDHGFSVPSGVYIYRLSAVSTEDHRQLFTETKKMLLLK